MSLTLTLKKCLSERNRLTKEFDSTQGVNISLTGTFKEGQSLLTPVFIVESSSDLSLYNYCEIAAFNRKYFMKVETVQTKIWRLSLEVDVLSTYATGIKACKAFVKRAEDKDQINYYMNDGALYTEQREVVTYHDFLRENVPATLGSETYYLIVAGG